METLQSKLVTLLLDEQHLILLLGIVALIWGLTLCKPIYNFLFVREDGSKSPWQALIFPLNLALSAAGVFLLGMTPFVKLGSRLMVMVLISAVATASWEWVIKYLDSWIRDRLTNKQPPQP